MSSHVDPTAESSTKPRPERKPRNPRDNNRGPKVCREFAAGDCKYGAECKFAHVDAATAAAQAEKPRRDRKPREPREPRAEGDAPRERRERKPREPREPRAEGEAPRERRERKPREPRAEGEAPRERRERKPREDNEAPRDDGGRKNGRKAGKGPKPTGPIGKLQLCEGYFTPGGCKYGDSCKFAHDKSELLLVRYTLADGAGSGEVICTALRSTAGLQEAARNPNSIITVCKTFDGTGCNYKDKCKNLHVAARSAIKLPEQKKPAPPTPVKPEPVAAPAKAAPAKAQGKKAAPAKAQPKKAAPAPAPAQVEEKPKPKPKPAKKPADQWTTVSTKPKPAPKAKEEPKKKPQGKRSAAPRKA